MREVSMWVCMRSYRNAIRGSLTVAQCCHHGLSDRNHQTLHKYAHLVKSDELRKKLAQTVSDQFIPSLGVVGSVNVWGAATCLIFAYESIAVLHQPVLAMLCIFSAALFAVMSPLMFAFEGWR